jgi:hypothetical protein
MHEDVGRQLLTPLVVESRRTERGPRQVTLVRLPAIRSCCVEDAVVRARWWARVNGALGQALLDSDAEAVRMQIGRKIAPTTEAEELLASLWMTDPGGGPATATARAARLAQLAEEVDEILHAGDALWAGALEAWEAVEAAVRAGLDLSSVELLTTPERWANAAISAARHARRPRHAVADLWQRILEGWRSQVQEWEHEWARREAETNNRRRASEGARTRANARSAPDQDPLARARAADVPEIIALFGLASDFGEGDVHRARRREVAKHHPDRAGGNAAMATAVNIMADRLLEYLAQRGSARRYATR